MVAPRTAGRITRLGGEQPGEFSNTRQDVVRLLLPHDRVGTGAGEDPNGDNPGCLAGLNINGGVANIHRLVRSKL